MQILSGFLLGNTAVKFVILAMSWQAQRTANQNTTDKFLYKLTAIQQ